MMFTVIAFLYAAEDGMAALQAFEAKTVPILADHGGRMEKAFAPAADDNTFAPPPDEVHILSFTSAEAYQSYRDDPRHHELAAERQAAIRETRIVVSGKMRYYI